MGVNSIIELERISFSYQGGRPVLDDLCFTMEEGAKLGLIGHNGSGKTTMLHIIMGLLRPSSGTIRAFGKEVKTKRDFLDLRRRIGFLFQDADDQLFCPTVLEDVAFGPLNLGKGPAEARQMAVEVLDRLNLRGFEDRVTHRLSGGEKKLVALATVLVMEPDALLLIVSHEYDFLARTTRHIYSMQKGRIVYDGDSSTLHSHYHRHLMGGFSHHHASLHQTHGPHTDRGT
ncbi:MAG: ABC transporter ATP-binding protein [Deltaproteobacteria bacterium]|nr:ABC transporter ATP-binding protein [Deltaproteobacteria bacterium]